MIIVPEIVWREAVASSVGLVEAFYVSAFGLVSISWAECECDLEGGGCVLSLQVLAQCYNLGVSQCCACPTEESDGKDEFLGLSL